MPHRSFGAVLCCLLAFGAAKAQAPFIPYAERGEFALAALAGWMWASTATPIPRCSVMSRAWSRGSLGRTAIPSIRGDFLRPCPFGVWDGKRPPRPRVPGRTQHRRPRLQPRGGHGWGSVRHVVLGGFGGPGRIFQSEAPGPRPLPTQAAKGPSISPCVLGETSA